MKDNNGSGGVWEVVRKGVEKVARDRAANGYESLVVASPKQSSATAWQCQLKFQLLGQAFAWTVMLGDGSMIPDIHFTPFEQSFDPTLEAILPILEAWDASAASYAAFFSAIFQAYEAWHLQLLQRRHPCRALRQLQLPHSALVACSPNPESPGNFTTTIQLPFTAPLPPKQTPLTQALSSASCAVRLAYTTGGDGVFETQVRVLGFDGMREELGLAMSDMELKLDRIGDPHATLDHMQAIIKRAVETYCERFVKSRVFVAAMISTIPGALLEYDDMAFKSCSFLIEVNEFHVYLHIQISTRFPEEQPTLTLQSVYHDDKQGHPYRERYTAYPYSPRWPGQELASRIRSFQLPLPRTALCLTLQDIPVGGGATV